MASVTYSLYWNGKDLPDELRALPAGAYAVTLIDEVPPLTEEEDEGLATALGSVDDRNGRALADVQETMFRVLHSRPHRQ